MSEWEMLFRLGASVLLALPVAFDREMKSRVMGLRTFPLVSLGTCSYVLIGIQFIGGESSDAQARVLQGLLAGIGFIGGGAILKGDSHVRGTASAACIWLLGAVGVASAYAYWALAIAISVGTFLILNILSRLKTKVNGENPDPDHVNESDEESGQDQSSD